jgi:hypothetical protein
MRIRHTMAGLANAASTARPPRRVGSRRDATRGPPPARAEQERWEVDDEAHNTATERRACASQLLRSLHQRSWRLSSPTGDADPWHACATLLADAELLPPSLHHLAAQCVPRFTSHPSRAGFWAGGLVHHAQRVHPAGCHQLT